MDRRAFFRGLVGSATAGVALATSETAKPKIELENPTKDIATGPWEWSDITDGRWHHYKQWNIRWTGWKSRPDSVEVVGQWIAQPKSTEHWFVVASFPGIVGLYRRMDSLNICVLEWQYPLILKGDSAAMDNARQKTLSKLLNGLVTGRMDYCSINLSDAAWKKELDATFGVEVWHSNL